MEIKSDRYTKIILTLIAVGLFANVFKADLPVLRTPFNPDQASANSIGIGSTMQGKGQRFITASPDGKTVYIWFREEDSQWYDRDKVHFVGQAVVEE